MTCQKQCLKYGFYILQDVMVHLPIFLWIICIHYYFTVSEVYYFSCGTYITDSIATEQIGFATEYVMFPYICGPGNNIFSGLNSSFVFGQWMMFLWWTTTVSLQKINQWPLGHRAFKTNILIICKIINKLRGIAVYLMLFW